jgi:tetratricopeptide (TPR) repeat protein
MRPLVIGCALATTLVLSAAPAQAQWCASYQHGGSNCYFTSQAQCQAAISGVGGACTPTQSARPAATQPAAPARAPARRTARPEQPRKKETPQRVERPAPRAPATAPSAPATATPAAATAPAAPAASSMPGNFAAARTLVLDGQYAAGIAAMQALGFDDHPDIATYVGFAARKLGRIEEAKSWYQRALAADPNHKLALSFQGMLRAEQGDMVGAQADLVRIGRLCGNTNCNEYLALQGVIAARVR